MVVHDEHLVELAFAVGLHHVAGQLGRLSELRIGRITGKGEHRRDVAVGEVADGLLATGGHFHFRALALLLLHELLNIAQHVGVEAAGKPAVRGDGNDKHAPHLVVGLQKRFRSDGSVLRRADQHIGDGDRPRQRVFHALRGAANLGSGDHFHGARDLLRRGDGFDSPFDVM